MQGVAGRLAGDTGSEVLSTIGDPQSDPQRAFIDAVESGKHNRLGYGGARGGGKSWALRRALVGRRLKHPGSRGLVLRRTYEELYGNHILPLLKALPGDCYNYNASQHRITFTNGSIQEFGFCKNDMDVLRYHGQEYDDIGIDEAEQWREEWFDQLAGSCRTVRKDLRPLIISTFMPGGIGHGWCKRRWVDRDFRDNENGDEYLFVRAKVWDNPVLTENDPDYVKTLEALPEDLRRAWLDGDFDVFAGQYFRELRREVHGFEGDPPPGWTFRCLDYGEQSPSAVYWVRVDREGVCWIYRELYGPGYSYSDLASKMIEMSVNPDGSPEQIRYTVTPPDLWAKRLDRYGSGTTKPVSGAEIMARHGVPSIVANNDRIEGWRRMREFLRYPPSLFVHLDNCPHWWRTVPALIHDEHNGEDVDTDCEDHCLRGDTLIDTYDGQKRITSIVGTDPIVMTPGGWAQGRNVRLVSKDQPVYTLKLTDGREITATADHRFWCSGRWVKLVQLTPGDRLTLLLPPDTIRYGLSGGIQYEGHRIDGNSTRVWRDTVLPLRAILPTQGHKAASSGMGASQREDTDRVSCTPRGFQPCEQPDREPATSIEDAPSERSHESETGQQATGQRTRSSGEMAQERSGQGVAQDSLREAWKRHAPEEEPCVRTLRYGIRSDKGQVLLKQLQISMAASAEEGLGSKNCMPDVRRGVHDRQVQTKCNVLEIVWREAEVESITEAGRSDVYCLTVPKWECFTVEGGVLTHNSGDATRYALSTRHTSAGLGGWARHVVDGEDLERQKRRKKHGRDSVVGY